MSKKKQNTIIYSTKEIADELGVSQKYISELVKDHGMPKVKHNQFNLVDVLRWHREYKVAEKEREIDKLKEDSKKYLEKLNAEIKELELQEKRKELVLKSDIKPMWQSEVKLIIQSIDGFIPRVAVKLKNISSITELKKILTEEMDKTKQQIVNSTLNI